MGKVSRPDNQVGAVGEYTQANPNLYFTDGDFSHRVVVISNRAESQVVRRAVRSNRIAMFKYNVTCERDGTMRYDYY